MSMLTMEVIGKLKVKKGLILLFLKHDLDGVVTSRTTAGNSYGNPVERC